MLASARGISQNVAAFRMKAQSQGSAMEGSQNTSRVVRFHATESVVISYSETARLASRTLSTALEQQGVQCIPDEKLGDPGKPLLDETARRIRSSTALALVVSAACRPAGWRESEAALAARLGKPVLLLLEDLQLPWPGETVPTLVCVAAEPVARFMAHSRPDAIEIRQLASTLLGDRENLRAFQRASSGAWRWERPGTASAPELSLEMSFADDTAAAAPEVKWLEARVENGLPVLLIGTTDGRRYKLSWSASVRALIPAPVFPGAPVIGFMHADFDSGREWPRAGEPPIELRLLGREVYGWHMSETFWRAFVGSLPKLLQTA